MASCADDSMDCKKHPGEQIQRLCVNCDVYVCLECVSEKHAGHKFKKFHDIFDEKKKELENIVRIAKDETIEDLKNKIDKTQRQKTRFAEDTQEKIQKVEERAKELKAAVDVVKNIMLLDFTKTLEENENEFDKAEDQLNKAVRSVKCLIENFEVALKTNNQNAIIEHTHTAECEIQRRIPQVSIPIFQDRNLVTPDINDQIKTLFGYIADENEMGSDCVEEDDFKDDACKFKVSTFSRMRNTAIKVKRRPTRRQNRRGDKIIISADVRTPSKIKVGNDSQDITSLIAISSKEAWVNLTCTSEWGKGEIRKIHKHGVANDIIQKESQDMILGHGGSNLILSTDSSSEILDFKINDKVFGILADLTPFVVKGILEMECGDLVVCLLDKNNYTVSKNSKRAVRILSHTGNLKHDIEFNELTSTRHFVHPYRVAERPDDLCVIDRLSDNEGRVVVVTCSGKVRFTYNGIENDLKRTFDPRGLAVTRDSYILIADRNFGIHQLTPLGQFARYIITENQGLFNPLSISVDDEDKVWVGCERGIIQRVKVRCNFVQLGEQIQNSDV